MLSVGLVRATDRVPDVEVTAEVPDVVRVMVVVVARARSERHHFEWVPCERIASVSLDGLENVRKQPTYCRCHMHLTAKQHDTADSWECVAEDELHRVGRCGRVPNRVLVQMVDLVHVLVEPLCVQHPVAPVEAEVST